MNMLKLLVFVCVVSFSIIAGSVVSAAPYGSNRYGDCLYAENCPTTSPSGQYPATSGATQTTTTPPPVAENPTTPLDDNGKNPSDNQTDEKTPPLNNPTEPANLLTGSVPVFRDNGFYNALGELIKKIPQPIAYSFPWLLILLIILLIIRLMLQSRNELRRLAVVKRIQQSEDLLKLEKDNFMMLTSHYLRTPITIMRGNVELMETLKRINHEVSQLLTSASDALAQEIATLLDKLQQDNSLKALQASSAVELKSLLKIRIVLPLIAIIGLFVIGQFLLIDFRVIPPRLIDLLVQFALIVLLVQIFLSKARQREINRHNRQDAQALLDKQRALDETKSRFIQEVADNLQAQVNAFNQQLSAVDPNIKEVVSAKQALSNLSAMIGKFHLISLLQTNRLKSNCSTFFTKEIADATMVAYASIAKKKAISLLPTIENSSVYQQKNLIKLVLGSLVENAIKFSGSGDKVEMKALHDDANIMFSISDTGRGISKDKQDLLFKPFSRTESVEVFNTEGLGFSLYLDKVIATYLQGSIDVDSEVGRGTTVNFTVPKVVLTEN